jgi:hypothetical protein
MKAFKTLQLFGLLIVLLSGCATVYQASEMATLESKHKKVAIIPFDVEVKYNRLPKNVTIEQIRENENDLGFVLQNQMYNQFLRKKDQFMIDFQDVDQTVMMLKRNKVDVEKLDEYSKDELARLLEVDAIVSGHLITTRPMSTGAAIVVGALFGVWGATNTADVTVSLHDGNDSKLLWKFNHVYSGSVGSSPEQLTKALMKPVIRKFPYKIK